MNIVLIGYRGTGKSTVGRLLAAKLKLELVSLDGLIVAQAGMPVPAIVEQHGWDHFRDLESAVVAEAAQGDGQVLDCGGGVILREQNVKRLKQAGPVVWLTASVAAITKRISGDTQRPSLTGKSFTDEVAEVLAVREPLYRAAADQVVDTDGLSPQQVAARVAKALQL